MYRSVLVVSCLLSLVVSGSEFSCYFNNACPFQMFGSKTPYDTGRGDLRDFKKLEGCEAVSLWSIHRHGNRNPGSSVTAAVKVIAGLKDQIVQAFDQGSSLLCATDIDEFRKWTWNETLETTPSYLTGVGYEELYGIGSRIRAAYPELLNGSTEDYYFRPTNYQRTITSAMGFVHGLTDGTSLKVAIDEPRDVDDVIQPYANCQKYQETVRDAPILDKVVAELESSPDYAAIRHAVQKRLGIAYQITTEDVFSIYELCRFYRSWDEKKQSPWCSMFTNEELVILDYRDDLRHYYRNGYGSWVNSRLGEQPLRDLYQKLSAATQGQGQKIVSYFSHDAMMEMVYCALQLFNDREPLRGDNRNPDRLWRTSYIGAMAINMITVLNRCQESGTEAYRVQIFVGEKVTELCPVEGCSWEEFEHMFKQFNDTNLNFCALDYPEPEDPMPCCLPDSAAVHSISWVVLLLLIGISRFW
ncbi:multiple inositol polyphosphate phosphatase 1-like [Pectinophora gossypiella]|uniref:Multiple inositol polyphosphate phosphatase 1 n=1 Tax=Pectinophora gossypiella TaxID=13191 RepID=A0A1E1W4B6_PECGO|nr:multiple inositol polyphosphate phosphatase 1-like [Pectinophora gossypiella]